MTTVGTIMVNSETSVGNTQDVRTTNQSTTNDNDDQEESIGFRSQRYVLALEIACIVLAVGVLVLVWSIKKIRNQLQVDHHNITVNHNTNVMIKQN